MGNYILVGYQHKNYTSKASGKQVVGTNLFFVCPAQYDDVKGSEVCTEFVRPELLKGVLLNPGNHYEILYAKGYGGKAVISDIIPVITEGKA
jgi:hypothetical protein